MPIHKIQLINKKLVADETWILHFSKPADFNFIPGQYAGFTLLKPTATRRFSLVSIPSDPNISVVTRMQLSDYKQALQALPIAGEIKLAGPMGNFILPQDEMKVPVVFIAGGVGIAPFYSMIRAEQEAGFPKPLTLFYGNRTLADAAFLSDLKQINHQHFQLVSVLENNAEDIYSEPGLIGASLIKKYLPDLQSPLFYICGSPKMVMILQETLLELSIPTDHILTEDFPGY